MIGIPLALVAGMGRHNRSIGKAGGLLRNVPDDMRRFAAKTAPTCFTVLASHR